MVVGGWVNADHLTSKSSFTLLPFAESDTHLLPAGAKRHGHLNHREKAQAELPGRRHFRPHGAGTTDHP